MLLPACSPGRRLRRNKRAGGRRCLPPISVGYPSHFFFSVPAGSHFVVLRCAPTHDPSTPQPNPARFSQNAAALLVQEAWCSEIVNFIQKRQLNTQAGLPNKRRSHIGIQMQIASAGTAVVFLNSICSLHCLAQGIVQRPAASFRVWWLVKTIEVF